VLAAMVLVLWAGCATPDRGFDLDTFHPSADQRLIARYYQEEALRLRQQAEEFDARAELYERMFGPGTDWVSSAKVLAQSYRLAADDRERLAQEHLQAGRGTRPSVSPRRPQTSSERIP
jgi:hypothetical protein